MLTSTIRPTTERWFGFDDGDYYYYGGGPSVNWLSGGSKSEELLKFENLQAHLAMIIDLGASVLGIIFNVFHIFILLHKELRRTVVFVLMIGAAFSDVIVFCASILDKNYEYKARRGFVEGFYGSDEQWWLLFFVLVSQGLQKFGRLLSATLGLFMTIIRTVSVMFPMSTVADRLMKARTGILLIIVLAIITGLLYLDYYSRLEITLQKGVFYASDQISNLGPHIYIEAYLAFGLSILYLMITVALIIALAAAKKRRKRLQGNDEKKFGDKTTLLVFLMATMFFVSLLLYSTFFVLGYYNRQHPNDKIIQVTETLCLIAKTVLTLNSIFHCFICYFLSSQYRKIVDRVLRLDRLSYKKKLKVKVNIVEPATKTYDEKLVDTVKESGGSNNKVY